MRPGEQDMAREAAVHDGHQGEGGEERPAPAQGRHKVLLGPVAVLRGGKGRAHERMDVGDILRRLPPDTQAASFHASRLSGRPRPR